MWKHANGFGLVVIALVASVGCNNEQGVLPPQTEEPLATLATATKPAESCAPIHELSALDHRKPVPLQPMMAWHQKQNMMEHLVAIQGITDGLAREDWQAIAKSSALIESSPQMQRMCQHMGAGAAGFTELALDFHSRADEIGVAAREQDSAKVLRATAKTLQACTSCHAAYRQEIVDAETWQVRTGSNHQPGVGHH